MVPYAYVKIIKFKQTEVTASKMSVPDGLNCGEAEAHGGKSCWQGPLARSRGRMEDAMSCIQEAERSNEKEALQSHTFRDLLPPTEPYLP